MQPSSPLDFSALLTDPQGKPIASNGPLTVIADLSRDERYALAVMVADRYKQREPIEATLVLLARRTLAEHAAFSENERQRAFDRGFAGLVSREVVADHGRDAEGRAIVTVYFNRLAVREGKLS